MPESTIGGEWGMYVDVVGAPGDALLPQNNLTGNDYARYEVTSGAVVDLLDAPDEGVALPDDAVHAVIVVKGAELNYRVGVNPTTAEGIPWFANTSHPFEDQRAFLENVRMIAVSTTASVRIMWGRQP